MKKKNINLDPLLSPRSIAILGGSIKENSYGLALLKMLIEGGYKGKIYPINPKYKSYKNIPFYASISDAPSMPDNTVIAVSASRVESAVFEAINAGTKSLTVLADISQEEFDGNIVKIANKASIPVCGPNSMGIHNLEKNIRISPFVFPVNLVPGGISMIIQSGSVLGALANNDRRLRFNFFISTGAESVTNASDYLLWVLNLPTTKVVGMFLEAIRDPDKFVEGLKLANTKNIPIVILKVGRTEVSSKLALSHTGALVGDFEVFKSVLEKYNAHLVYSIDELASSLQVFSQYQSTKGKGIASIHDSGGERELIVDIADDLSVPFASLTKVTKKQLALELEATMDVNNPLDAWGSGHGADQLFKNSFLHLLSDRNVSLGLYVMDWRQDYYLHLMHERVLFEIIDQIKKPVIAVSNYSLTIDPEMAKRFLDRGIPLIKGTREALVAVKNLLNNKKLTISRNSHKKNKRFFYWEKFTSGHHDINVIDGFKFLSDYGIEVAEYRVCNSISDAIKASKKIGFPIVIKTLKQNIHHKTEVKGVYTNIQDLNELKEKYLDLETRLGKKIMLGKMILSGIEWSLGVKNDAHFGPTVMISLGGTLIDLLEEKLVLLAPFSSGYVEEKLKNLKSFKLLKGFRGSNELSVSKLCETASKLSFLAFDFKGLIQEIDINPIIVTEKQAIAVDNVFISNKNM